MVEFCSLEGKDLGLEGKVLRLISGLSEGKSLDLGSIGGKVSRSQVSWRERTSTHCTCVQI